MLILIVTFLMPAAGTMRAQSGAQTEGKVAEDISGGQFTIAKTAIAGGGTQMQNQSSEVQSTAGQTIAGGISAGGALSLRTGFWTPDAFAPTAATANVGGRVVTAQGKGIRHALVTIHFPSGEVRSTLTGTFGFYRFSGIEVGAVYVFTVSGKRIVFPQATQVVTVDEDRNDINFAAGEN